MLSSERRTNDDWQRRYVTEVFFGVEDLDVLQLALAGHTGALGEDEQGRDRVGRHLNAITNQGEPYSLEQLHDLRTVLIALQRLWKPQTEVSWWRSRGATGPDDAVEGLATERGHQLVAARRAVGVVNQIVDEMQRGGIS